MNAFTEGVYWNARSYGTAIRLTRKQILGTLTALAVLIPLVFPVWTVPLVAKFIRGDFIFRYGGLRL